MHLMQDPISTHIFMVNILLGVMIINLYFVVTQKNFVLLSRRLKFMTPIYHASNAIVAYTGAIVAAFLHIFNYKIVFMIILSIFLMVIEIKRYKKQRVIKSNDKEFQKEFYIYAKKIYIIEIVVLVLAHILFTTI